MPAAIAATAPPPAASTAVAANWAEPANNSADITIGATRAHHRLGEHPERDRQQQRRRPRRGRRHADRGEAIRLRRLACGRWSELADRSSQAPRPAIVAGRVVLSLFEFRESA